MPKYRSRLAVWRLCCGYYVRHMYIWWRDRLIEWGLGLNFLMIYYARPAWSFVMCTWVWTLFHWISANSRHMIIFILSCLNCTRGLWWIYNSCTQLVWTWVQGCGPATTLAKFWLTSFNFLNFILYFTFAVQNFEKIPTNFWKLNAYFIILYISPKDNSMGSYCTQPSKGKRRPAKKPVNKHRD